MAEVRVVVDGDQLSVISGGRVRGSGFRKLLNGLGGEMSRPIRGVGARELDADELKCGWLWVGFGAQQRVAYVEPDANDPDTASSEIEALIDGAAVADEGAM